MQLDKSDLRLYPWNHHYDLYSHLDIQHLQKFPCAPLCCNPSLVITGLQPGPQTGDKNTVADMGSKEEGSSLEKRFNFLFNRVKMLHLGRTWNAKKVGNSVYSGQDLDLSSFITLSKCWVIWNAAKICFLLSCPFLIHSSQKSSF